VLMAQPQLLLLDEPFSNLDVSSARGMVERLMAYVAEPGADGVARTLLMTTHQAELARPLAKTTITLNAGQIVSVDGEAAEETLP
jgi:ABC-type multidrug transport system ATPase subunit